MRELLDLTPGGLGNVKDVPNTEYPWLDHGEWRHTPFEHQAFSVQHALDSWLQVASRVTMSIAAEHGT